MKNYTTNTMPIFAAALAATSLCSCAAKGESKPNIVIIYADDMGYGDMSCQNPDSKIQTPNLDRLASEGMRFTNAHSSSGISSPSRYALLTGNYHWRREHAILDFFETNHFFKEGEVTMPVMLKAKGYKTAMVGKWHLGWNWNEILTDEAAERLGVDKGEGFDYKKLATSTDKDYDWNKEFNGGPTDRGFDYYYGDGTINFPPYCWIENKTFVTKPTETLNPLDFVALEGKCELRPGPKAADWSPEKVLPTLANKAVEVIGKQSKEEPFFLYFALSAPHAPIVPAKEFHGKSKAGYYGDFVVQCDDIVGRVVAELKAKGLYDNTLIIFSADNGPEHYAYPRQVNFDHNSTASLRGVKRDLFDGGHRIPFIVKWSGEVEAGAVTDEVVNQVDIMATLASIVGYDLPNDAAVDSYDLLPLWRGKHYDKPLREATIHNTHKDYYGVRQGDWVMINNFTGTVSYKDVNLSKFTPLPKGKDAILFNIKEDRAQRIDLSDKYPEKVAALKALLERYQKAGRSVPERK